MGAGSIFGAAGFGGIGVAVFSCGVAGALGRGIVGWPDTGLEGAGGLEVVGVSGFGEGTIEAGGAEGATGFRGAGFGVG